MADPTLVVRVAASLAELKANLAEGVNQVETWKGALKSAAASFDGTRIVQQASAAAAAIQNAGGVTTLTAAETAKANAIFTQAAEKLEIMGKGGSYSAQQFAALATQTKQTAEKTNEFQEGLVHVGERLAELFAIREVLNFSKEVLQSTAALEDLKLATGISTDGLQRLGYIGQSFGIDMSLMSRAVEQFSAKLGSGDASATAAVEKLGLNVKALVAAGPEEAFIQFADAAGRVSDQTDRAALYVEAFGGKLGKMLMALRDVRTAMNDVPQDAIISESTIKSAHDFEVGLEHLETRLKAYTAEVIAGIANGTLLLSGSFGVLGQGIMAANAALGEHSKTAKEHADVVLPSEISHTDLLANRLAALRADAIDPLTQSQKNGIVELEKYGVAQKEIADLVGSTVIAVHEYVNVNKQAEEAAKKAAETAKRVAKETVFELARLWADYADKQISFYGTDVEKAQAAANRRYEIAVAEAEKKGIVDKAYYDGLEARRQQDLAHAKVDGAALASHSIEALQAAYDKAQATFSGMAASGKHFTQEQVQYFRELRDEALDKLHSLGEGHHKLHDGIIADLSEMSMAEVLFGDHLNDTARRVHTLAGEWITAAEAKARYDAGNSVTYDLSTPEGMAYYRKLNPAASISADMNYFKTHTLQEAIAAHLVNPYAGYTQNQFADGVENFSGGRALVGERGPEIVNLPRGSSVIPNHQLGGPAINITINGSVLSDEQKIAAAVSKAVMHTLRGQGLRLPAVA